MKIVNENIIKNNEYSVCVNEADTKLYSQKYQFNYVASQRTGSQA